MQNRQKYEMAAKVHRESMEIADQEIEQGAKFVDVAERIENHLDLN